MSVWVEERDDERQGHKLISSSARRTLLSSSTMAPVATTGPQDAALSTLSLTPQLMVSTLDDT